MNFLHPGLLHTESDFTRIRTNLDAEKKPWTDGWDKLLANPHSQLSYVMRGPLKVLVRGSGRYVIDDNFEAIFHDLAAAYQQAIRWKISGEDTFARSASDIINAWSLELVVIKGNEDRYLAAGLYGYQLANVVELLRDFSGFTATDFKRATRLLLDVFYPLCHDFLTEHVGAGTGYYWANWDLCNTLAMLSIGIVADDVNVYNEAIDYFYNGAGSGSIKNMFVAEFSDGTAQGQEAGRDQPHCLLDFCELGCIAQTAFNQGLDLFSYDDNIILRGAEYVAKYNLGHDVEYVPYATPWWSQLVVSAAGRGELRPLWELFYHHYSGIQGVSSGIDHVKAMRDKVVEAAGGAEGGGGDYGDKSGGFDQLGFGTLLYSREMFEMHSK